MDVLYRYSLSKQDFGRIMRQKKRWGILGFIAVDLALIIDGVLAGLVENQSARIAFLVAVVPLAALAGIAWYLTFTDGGVHIYGECTANLKREGTLEVQCTRSDSKRSGQTVALRKVMKPRRIERFGDFSIVFGEKRQWVIVPESDLLREIDKNVAQQRH
ncbi:MAG: hypothetical protein LKG11_00515 [Bacilli bacterium]|jgi:hypothetical protein|nr:hypothetical protein [Bacilli bacterium]